PETIRLCGLDAGTLYRIKLVNHNYDELKKYMQIPNSILINREGLLATGELLMQIGISLPVLAPQSALLINCSAVSINQKG
ncbi:MAG: hypothetical protein NTX25_01165, partial [Proteobacteria bacterium]|nr:hypothetical protein [Pseudomonadota bacterium]